MEPISLPKAMGAFISLTSTQPKSGSIRRIPGEHRDVDGSQQQLLVPYIFEFPTDDLIRLQQRKHLLEEVGVYLEEYGANQLILREHPIWMKEEEIESGIYEMCDMLLLTKEVSIKKYRAELAIMMSCKRSIKANHTLDDYSARDLIYQCPNVTTPITALMAVRSWLTSPSRIWKRCSDAFRKITPVTGIGQILIKQ